MAATAVFNDGMASLFLAKKAISPTKKCELNVSDKEKWKGDHKSGNLIKSCRSRYVFDNCYEIGILRLF